MSAFNYNFNSMGRIGADVTDNSQRNVSNTKFANYLLSDYTSELLSDSHVRFATEQPTVMFSGMVHGRGLSGAVIDSDSYLMINRINERPLEKLQLNARPFLTVPYLGRGSCNPSIESQLLQGEMISEKKSVNTIMEKSFTGYTLYSSDDKLAENVSNFKVEESVMDGWVRGGMASREISYDKDFTQKNRPNNAF
jgi:hypothetical protein